ncbi:hypothetical protein GCM10010420_35860 [Streptomyces glaucosporus]|uniref:Uncharacterized protein n=1 Tax=Streptomyces glaucosporus TaxID=284044 RepID=A0ABN3IJS7_9ACTN
MGNQDDRARDAQEDTGRDTAGETGAERRADPAGRGPGAHSGRETQFRPGVVPGTASAAEGYSGGGTVGGEPLKGVEAPGTGTEEAREKEVGPGEESHGKRTQ